MESCVWNVCRVGKVVDMGVRHRNFDTSWNCDLLVLVSEVEDTWWPYQLVPRLLSSHVVCGKEREPGWVRRYVR
jgi:hypothetical protein